VTKYSTDPGDSDTEKEDADEPSKQITVSISDWLKEALDRIVQQSDANAREAIRRPLEYAVIEWNRTFEQRNDAFDIRGEHVWEPNFRCIECKSSNKFLFRKLDGVDNDSEILCLNCDHEMSREEVTRLSRAAGIQEMDPYTLEKEGVKIRHEYEGEFRTPMRFECKDCKERELTLSSPSEIDALICPHCGKKGRTLKQVRGPAVSGFAKYPPDKYHTEPSLEPIGRGVSRGEYDHLEKAYKDGSDDI
jgi:transcription elongation factor Elf1